MSNIYLLEACNLFCGDHDPSASNHLVLEEIKLPDLEEKTIAHEPGGGVMGVDWATTMVMPLNPTFKLKGMDPERLKLFGLGSTLRRKFTAYGVIREKRSNLQLEGKAIIEGVITKISGSAFKRGDGMDHDYEIKEVTSYQLYIDKKEVFYIDVFTNRWSVGGVSQVDEMNNILRIPGAA